MQIPQELFHRIVGDYRPDAAGKPAVLPVGCRRAAERREASRVPFGKRTQIRRDGGPSAGKWETIVFTDVSRGGIGFLCDEELRASETFVVKMPQADGNTARLRCAARRCEQGGFGGVAFLVGATFEQVIDEPSIRLNDDDGRPVEWNDSIETGLVPEIACTTAGASSQGKSLMRTAFGLLKAVDPIRNTALFIRRCNASR